ncbi:hypothetical protein [Agrobacterium radiobacter]|uniref:hypothetical protein n=1 Tax=Agrobacterium radiobacter TaxID=362 RepID=UPI00037577B1|nr:MULTISPECIES: hypothetical protein [Agrobacterium tumefaciens complex]EPR18587.1 hypothetical protein L902_03430 [Agrobacterium radiobacter DSM 30147]KAB0455382.1 hypothetical protein F7R04_25530 [Agrobacterium tumefaciens]KWT78870.1 hypothetical protein ASH09_23900 [Agrobacterium radiobacter]NIB12752.1 hypothetical protein [Agrobacterium radiobacter]OOO40918.1 hypothetical protein BS628_00415 [Agrobacterium radiobacter]
MPKFAIVSEGPTDQVVLDRVISLICESGFEDDVIVNFAQPIRDETDSNKSEIGGWELVLEYCSTRISDALASNDYVVIQIDTDCGEEENYGVPLTTGGRDRPFVDLIVDVEQLIAQKIGEPLFSEFKERFIFAVSVHSLESWLLLYFFSDRRTKNSFKKLQYFLKRKWNYDRFEKEIGCYQSIAKKIKHKDLSSFVGGDHSFGFFLKRLTELEPLKASKSDDVDNGQSNSRASGEDIEARSVGEA